MLIEQVSRSLRELVAAVAVAVAVLLLMCVSLGFGTYAAFQYLSIIAGSAGAAFIISAAYLALFMAAAGFWLWPTRARRPGRVNMPSVPAQAAISDPTIKSLIADANLQQQRLHPQ